MDNRREFLKKAAMLAGGASLAQLLPDSIVKAMSIDPKVGSTFRDAEHVVLLMQENRSFDHTFGTLKGVRGFNDPRAILQPNGRKVWLQSQADGKTYAPFRLDMKDSKVTWMGCLPHSWKDQIDARNDGKMNRWLDVKKSRVKEFANMPLTMGYYTREDIPFYYSMADAFTVCDQHFCSSLTGTNPNRLYFWTGNIRENLTGHALVNNGDSEFSNKANWKTFPERLTDAGVDWKIYQNEISSSSAGYIGQENSWLGNFGCNTIEYFPQYAVKYSQRYRDLLAIQRKKLEDEIKKHKDNGATDTEQLDKLKERLQSCLLEQEKYTEANFDKLDAYTKEIHRRALVNNSADPDYMKLEEMAYQDKETTRKLMIPKGDILYQFRKDVDTGNLPTVSWLVSPQLFSDHPDSPWFGAWYLSEVMEILTKNPEVWKKTIFILTYDENDGYFDHIAPFVAPNPKVTDSGKVSEGIDSSLEYVTKEQQYNATSGRESSIGLGYRVPMIIASPWSRGGWVNSQVFDHTSPIQFLEHFLTQKTGKTIKEENITAWRRAVCGDLTSTFRPYNGEKIEKPTSIEKSTFMEQIHQAKFKDAPSGYQDLTDAEIAKLNQNPRSSSYFPQQESGIIDSCALPYELYTNAIFDHQTGKLHVTMSAGRMSFAHQAAGAPFTIYYQSDYKGAIGESRNYAVKAGDQVSDNWTVTDFDEANYRLKVYGPNGFYRVFAGTINNPELSIKCQYEQNRKSYALTGNLLLKIENTGNKDLEVLISNASYSKLEKKVKIRARKNIELIWDTQNEYGWYDIKVECKGHESFLEQFAGRVETGKPSKSDPAMA